MKTTNKEVQEAMDQTAAGKQRKEDTAAQQPTEVVEDTQSEVVEEQAETVPSTIDQLFATPAVGTRIAANQTAVSAELVREADSVAHYIVNKTEHEIGPKSELPVEDRVGLKDRLLAAAKDHDAMDDFIMEQYDVDSMPTDFLVGSKEDLTKLLRSQQSKRSRAKGKPQSKETILTMMAGAVAEYMLRKALGEPKSSGGASNRKAGFTDEQIAKYQEDAEELKKAIRNVQSKISIAKSKAGFDEKNPTDHFLQLKADEQFLKNMRDNRTPVVTAESVKAMEVTKKANELMAGLSAEEVAADPEKAAALFKQMQEILATTDTTTEEE